MEKDIDSSLDSMLVQIGSFGKYQLYLFGLVCFTVIINAAAHLSYVYVAMDLTYRCQIPGCDQEDPQYSSSWLDNAVPKSSSGTSEKCSRYKPYYNGSTLLNNSCTTNDFNKSETLTCSSYVYESEEKTILQEYDLHCDENLWKLTSVGSVSNAGQFLGIFISGIISDKFGRRPYFIWGLVLSGICGIIKLFLPSYIWFLVFEFLDAAVGSGSYICGFVLCAEFVGPDRRALSGAIIGMTYAVGEMLVAGAAYAVKNWRHLILIIYIPEILIITYLLLLPESPRWHLINNHTDRAKKTLRKMAKINGSDLNEKDLEIFDKLAKQNGDHPSEKLALMTALKSRILFLRLIPCGFCWVTSVFLYYGLTLMSVSLSGDKYIDFALTAFVEIPAFCMGNFLVEKFGRKKPLWIGFLVTGGACLGYVLMPDLKWPKLIIYLLGKFSITVAFSTLYVITSEMFPTSARQSFMGTCSTIGRIGSMLAPQTPLLAKLWKNLPLVIFAGLAAVAAMLSFSFPETVNRKLPDTIEEAENIGNAPEMAKKKF